MPPEGLLQLSGGKFYTPATSHFSLKALSEQLIRCLHLLRQTLQGLFPQLRRHSGCLMRKFTGIDFMTEAVPDETTLCKFRHLLEENGLNKLFFDAINRVMLQTGHMMKGGTIVDATIINAPSSTKNAEKKRDPEMHQTKKGNEWKFGMKCHIGVDAGSGLVHTMTVTAANTHDITQQPR